MTVHLKIAAEKTACGKEERRAQRLTIEYREVTCRGCRKRMYPWNPKKKLPGA